jgi:multiple sugar transport system substrate-binding protein
MKKLVSVVCLLLFASVLLFAGGEQEGSESSEKGASLSYWHLWGGSRTELIEKVVDKFQENNPNYQFEVTFTPPNELQKKVVQAAGTETLPDIVQLHSSWMPDVSAENTLVDVSPYLEEDGIVIEDVLVEAEAKRCYYKDGVYSLPNVTAGGMGLFFYNKDLMEKAGLDPVEDAPQDWAEFTAVSKTIVEELNTGDQLDVVAWDPHQMAGQPAIVVFSFGAGYPTVSEDGRESLMDSPGVVRTAKQFDNYIQEVYGKYGGYRAILEWNSRVAGTDTGAAQVQAFIKEAQTFYVSGSWTIGQINKGNPDMDFSILPVPGFEGRHGGISKHGWSYAISKNSKNKEAAWEFLKFITIDPEGNGWFCKQQGRPCPIASVNDDPVYQEMGRMWENLVKSMQMDIFPDAPAIHQDVVKPWLRDIPARRIAGESIEEIMNDIDVKYQDYLDDLYE